MEERAAQIQCAGNGPAGISEIIRRSDEMEVLRNAIDSIEKGIVLINAELCVEFVNKTAQRFWSLSPDQCRGPLSVAEFIGHVRRSGLYAVPDDEMEAHVKRRVAMIQAGDPMPVDIPVKDGRTIRAQCTALVGGGRMLTYTDVTDLVQQVKQQEVLATTDVLTGLHNRRHFLKLADAEWGRSRRYDRELSLMFFDIDNLKAINDALGHDAGDQAIMRVAEVCNAVKRAPDIAGRIGGDEFVILMPEANKYAALLLAERLHEAIGRERLKFDGICTRLAVSIGIAQAGLELSGLPELLKLADTRLYRAKRAGRNCTAWCDDSTTLLRV